MGSPIKSTQSERKQAEPNKKNSWMSLTSNRKKLIFYSLLTGLIILSLFLIFKYSLVLPTLDARIFESFIQVIGILLGFTVVGIFYYLGKIDDHKHHLINSLLAYLSRIKTVTSREDEQVNKFLEALGKVDDANKFYRGEQIRQIISQILQIKRENASVLKGSDAIIKDATKYFEEMTDLIRRDLTNIIISYGVAIAFSFVALFLATSGIGRPTSNLWIWDFLILIVSSIIITSRFFSVIWKDFQNLSNTSFVKTIKIDAFLLGK